MSSAFSVVALVAAYNEADIIHHVVADLIAQGVGVYFLDDNSTDDTATIVEAFLGRGVLAVEKLPARGPTDSFDWERILARKSALAAELDATWFIHHDADEFRESPWPLLTLRDAICRVDALGFNAIDFAGLDFWPVDDRFKPGNDVRAALTCYTDFAPYDRVQIRCWKKTGHSVDLASSGGHEATFPDRKVFPLRFVLRHYPIRSQAHGERKVFTERRSRFLEAERARGWHVQYDATQEGESFLRAAEALTPYDADEVRLRLTLRNRDVETLERLRANLETTAAEFAALEAFSRHQKDELDKMREELNGQSAYIKTLTTALAQARSDIGQWRDAVTDLSGRLDALQCSLSWRLTAPARAVLRLLRGN
jgi:glycosyl transferase family 2